MENINIYYKTNNISDYFTLCKLCLENVLTDYFKFKNFIYKNEPFGNIYVIGSDYRKLTGIENKGLSTFNYLRKNNYIQIESAELFIDLVQSILYPNAFYYAKKVNDDGSVLVIKFGTTEFYYPKDDSPWKIIDSLADIIEHYKNGEYLQD